MQELHTDIDPCTIFGEPHGQFRKGPCRKSLYVFNENRIHRELHGHFNKYPCRIHRELHRHFIKCPCRNDLDTFFLNIYTNIIPKTLY